MAAALTESQHKGGEGQLGTGPSTNTDENNKNIPIWKFCVRPIKKSKQKKY